MTTATEFHAEVSSGQRFEFGKNWRSFLSTLDDGRIAEAENSLKTMLRLDTLKGKRFLDVGSGSGLFSLAAMRLGAEQVHSFDYDPSSVACTRELKQRYFADARNWTVDEASVLDTGYLGKLGQWDIVYSWGVLHHTGDMWTALGNVATLVNQGGLLFIAIYNDQGVWSRAWRRVKAFYNQGALGRALVSLVLVPYFVMTTLAADIIKRRHPIRSYSHYKRTRGMSRVHDWFDWMGGYPFDVAKPEQIFEFYRDRGFRLEGLKTAGGRLGNNEFVFRKQ